MRDDRQDELKKLLKSLFYKSAIIEATVKNKIKMPTGKLTYDEVIANLLGYSENDPKRVFSEGA